MDILAANRAFSAITVMELPPEFRKQKPLGRGATSIVYPCDENTVWVFTKDTMKIEWLRENKLLLDYSTYDSKIGGKFVDLSIYKCKVKRLYPTDTTNKRLVKQILDYFNKTTPGRFAKFHTDGNQFSSSGHKRSVYLNNLIEQLEERMHSVQARKVITHFVNFLMNYDVDQYDFDLGQRQFLQTKDGELVFNDPIVSREIMDAVRPPNKGIY